MDDASFTKQIIISCLTVDIPTQIRRRAGTVEASGADFFQTQLAIETVFLIVFTAQVAFVVTSATQRRLS